MKNYMLVKPNHNGGRFKEGFFIHSPIKLKPLKQSRAT